MHLSMKNVKLRGNLPLKGKAPVVWGEKMSHALTCFSKMTEESVKFQLLSYHMHDPENRIPKLLNKLETPGVISTVFASLPPSF